MAKVDETYKTLCNTINNDGKLYIDNSRNVSRRQVTSHTFKHSFNDGFPAISSKKLPYKFVKGELIWFLRGDTHIKFLLKNGIPIWNKDAYNLYVKVTSANLGSDANHMYKKNLDGSLTMFSMEEFIHIVTLHSAKTLSESFSYERYTMGDVGRNYSAQWRSYRGDAIAYNPENNSFIYERHDQIKQLVKDMVDNIMSTRLKVESWNPSEIDKTALPPCHDHFQVIGTPLTFQQRLKLSGFSKEAIKNSGITSQNNKEFLWHLPKFGFELHWNQRSTDTFLGLPFNVASYATLAVILEEMTGYPALGIEGNLKCVHFYDNQFEAVETLMKRDTNAHENCTIEVSKKFKSLCELFRHGDITIDELFNHLSVDMFKLKGYTSDEAINVEMLAPIKI